MTAYSSSALLRFYALASVFGNLVTQTYGHGIEVRQCITPNGNLRFFVEHWHNDLSDPSEASTMQIKEQFTGQAATIGTVWADGMFNNKNIYDPNEAGGWGCVNDDTPSVVSTCHDTAVGMGYKHDWVYYERSATCNVEITYTLLSGDTVYLMDGCNGNLYPSVVGPATFQDSAPPVPKIDGEDLPKTISLIADDSSSGTAVVTFDASASDDCDIAPVVTTNYPSGYAFPVGTTIVKVTATDNKGNNSTDYLTIVVEPWVNECLDPNLNNCHDDAICSDLQDGYHCQCKEGFTGDGFTCNDVDECATKTHECSTGYDCVNTHGSHDCININECLDNTHNCDVNAGCTDVLGSFYCTCNSGYSGTGTEGTCIDVDECNGSNNCDAYATCNNLPGSYYCTCPEGWEDIDSDGTICNSPSPTYSPSSSPTASPSSSPSTSPTTSPTSSPTVSPSSSPSTSPTTSPTSSPTVSPSSSPSTSPTASPTSSPTTTPTTSPSTTPTTSPTVNIDECADSSLNNCHADADCINIPGGFHCACKLGFEGDGTTCNDIDECAVDSHDCLDGYSCVNNAGSFDCINIDECSLGVEVHGCHEHATCFDTEGSWTCTCNSGFSGDGTTTCADVNECDLGTDNCDVNSNCVNTVGSFRCDGLISEALQEWSCNEGWQGDGVTCTDVNECELGTDNCHEQSNCVNVDGSFRCDGLIDGAMQEWSCNEGWQGDGVTCSDVNECGLGTDNCHEQSNCVNTVGSFRCDGLIGEAMQEWSCNEGWTGDGVTCVDVNECLDSNLHGCDENAQCTNTIGSWACTCVTGFSGDGFSCQDVDECSLGTDDCDESGTCANTIGSWACACPEGWIDVAGDGTSCETAQPTRSPTPSPTESPTLSPSLLPSMQPSIVEQTITTSGSLSVNVDICSFNADQLAAYVKAALDAVKEVTGCLDEADCQAEITSVCGAAGSGGRKLQTSTWQLDYEITETFTCEYASCDSATDTSTTNSIVDSIVGPIEASLSSDEFLTVLSTNILNSGSFSADIVTCLAVWGIVDEPELEVETGNVNATGLFYPDWESDSGTCLQGEAPLYMELNPEAWLYDNLEACCDRYFAGWNHNKCMNVKGSGLWYVSHKLEKCVTDCEEGQGATCGGLANPISDDLFADPRSCCENELAWRFTDFCEADSLHSNCYAGTGKYYRGDTAGVEVCVKDCDPVATGDDTCGGLVEDSYVVLHDTPEECCSQEYNWMTIELCAARTTQTDISVYWPDKTNSKCVLDSVTPAQDLSISVYNSTAACCEEGVHWLTEAECLTASGDSAAVTSTNKFFVDWKHEKCIKDCEGSAPCAGAGVAQSWDELFETTSACCDRISWVPREECVYDGTYAIERERE